MLVRLIATDTYEVSTCRAEWWTATKSENHWHIVSYRGQVMSPVGNRAKQIRQAIRDHLGGGHDAGIEGRASEGNRGLGART